MLGPYRVPCPVEPDPPDTCPAMRCDAHARSPACAAMPPYPPRFPASIGCALQPPRRALPPGFARALSAAATLLLLVASASLGAVSYSVVHLELATGARAAAPKDHAERAPRAAPPPTLASLAASGGALAAAGPDTHAVDELWRRAEQLAADGADVTLVRATLPRAAAAEWMGGLGYLRVLHEDPAGAVKGLRIVDLGERSAPALAGVRKGDLVTALNGWPLASPEEGLRAFTDAGEARALVAELWREGRRIALRLDWQG